LLQRSFLLPTVFTVLLFFIFLNFLSPLCCVRPLALHLFLTARISCSTIPSQPKTKKVDLTVALLTRKSVQQKGLHKKDGQPLARAQMSEYLYSESERKKETLGNWKHGKELVRDTIIILISSLADTPKAYLPSYGYCLYFFTIVWAVLFCYFGYLCLFLILLLDMPMGLILTFLSREATIALIELLLTVVFFGYYFFSLA
jgi:hypothetical protein